MKILGVIVTYNPKIERLNKNISAVIGQVDELLIVDNNSVNIKEIRNICEEGKIGIHEFDCNMGIAFALSNGLEYGRKNNYDYIFTLDQDSICSNGMIEKLTEGFFEFKEVAICSPEIFEIHLIDEKQHNFRRSEVIIIDRCQTSGSLCSVQKLIEVGGFNDELFIDEVDHELCYRLERAGYLILKNKDTYLLHEIGEPVKRKFLFKEIVVSNHDISRLYYIGRNLRYIIREFGDLEQVRERKIQLELIKRMLKIIFYEKNKGKKIKTIIEGIIDGKNFTTKMSRRDKKLIGE